MTITNGYVTLDEIRARLGGQVPADQNSALESAITDACRMIDRYCGQQFYDSGSASARTFTPRHNYRIKVDPFSTTTGLIVKTDADSDATYETTWTAADYELDYFGGDFGQTISAPYDTIRAVGAYTWPLVSRSRSVQVTARWGWAAVPADIAGAAAILAVDLWKRKDAPFGIATGTVDFGGQRIGRDMLAQVASKLDPYRRADRTFGIA